MISLLLAAPNPHLFYKQPIRFSVYLTLTLLRKVPTSHCISVYHFYTKYSVLYFLYCNFSYCCLSVVRNFVSLADSEGVLNILPLSQFSDHLELLQDLLSSKELPSSCTIFHNFHTWNVTTIICSHLVQINSGEDMLTV